MSIRYGEKLQEQKVPGAPTEIHDQVFDVLELLWKKR